MTRIEKAEKLLQHVEKFIKDHAIHCPDVIAQHDQVLDNAYEFIEGCGEIAGYYKDPGDEGKSMTDLQKMILAIVEDHSGGLKMIELAVELWKQGLLGGDPTLLEQEVKEMPELGVIEYRGPDVGDGYRLKQFVYRKLAGATFEEEKA